jgi:hypothetical protein
MFVYVSILLVLEILDQVKPPLVDDSHLITGAELPVRVNVPLAEAAQPVVIFGDTVPAVGEEITVTPAVAELLQPAADVPVTV